MKLTAQTFQEIVRSIRAVLPPSRERSNPQVHGQTSHIQGTASIVMVRPGTVCDPVTAAVTDLTTTTISLIFKKAMKTGERFLLLLKDQKGAGAILYTVVRWHPIGTDVFAITANFARELHTGEMREDTQENPARFSAPTDDSDTIDIDHVRLVEEQLLRAWTVEG